MSPASVITLIIGALVAAVMIIIGVTQLRSKTPVGFYTGEEPPAAKCLKSMRSWNMGHGLLWITYGIIIIVCYVLAVFATTDPLVSTLLMFCGTVFPILLLVLGHRALIRTLMIV